MIEPWLVTVCDGERIGHLLAWDDDPDEQELWSDTPGFVVWGTAPEATGESTLRWSAEWAPMSEFHPVEFGDGCERCADVRDRR